jgi:RNase P/RNase MRP subunit POP5
VHLRSDIHASSLPDAIRERLLSKRGRRITSAGVIIIKAQRFAASNGIAMTRRRDCKILWRALP